MQFSTITTALAALTTLATMSTASPLSNGTGTSVPALPYPLNSTLEWYGPSNGVNITLFGSSYEDILQQLKDRDPSSTLANTTHPNQPVIATNGTRNSSDILPRSDDGQGARLCCPVAGQPWQQVPFPDSDQALDPLLSTPDGHYFRTAPQTCSFVNGYHGAGVFICNSLPTSYYYIPINNIGYYGSLIVNNCPLNWENGNCGQQFDTSGYNVIIAKY